MRDFGLGFRVGSGVRVTESKRHSGGQDGKGPANAHIPNTPDRQFVRVLLSVRLPSEFRLSFTRMARISNALAFMSSNVKPASVAGFRLFRILMRG
jgi:hypothetical protein